MKEITFRNRKLPFLLIFLCSKEPRCSKEIAHMLGNPYNDRNIQKYLNRLVQFGFLKYVGKGINSTYPKSKFFVISEDLRVEKIVDIKDFFDKTYDPQRRKMSISIKTNVGIKSKSGIFLIPQGYEKIGEIKGLIDV